MDHSPSFRTFDNMYYPTDNIDDPMLSGGISPDVEEEGQKTYSELNGEVFM